MRKRRLGVLGVVGVFAGWGCATDSVTFGTGAAGSGGGDSSGSLATTSGGGMAMATTSGGGNAATTTTGSASGGSTGTGGAPATCGDGIINVGEDCDGSNLNGKTCTDFGFSKTEGLVCESCTLDPSGCKATCDGALLEPGETCDGSDLGGKSCQDYGFSEAAGLTCSSMCELDSSGCQSTCDGQKLEQGEDCDGTDLGGKTCKDYGFSNGAGLTCDNNCTPDPAGCKGTCGDKIVEPDEDCDDGNNNNDDGCNNNCKFGGTTCAGGILISATKKTISIKGTTVGGGSHSANGTNCSGEETTPDRVYTVQAMATGFFTAWIDGDNSTFDSMLYALTDCLNPSSVILCEDRFNQARTAKGGEVISFPVKQGDQFSLIVDGYNGATGTFGLNVDISDGTCADPVPIPMWASSSWQTGLGSTSPLAKVHKHSCGGNNSPEAVYELELKENIPAASIRTFYNTNFDTVLAVRKTCTDATTELSCGRNNHFSQGNLVGERANFGGLKGQKFFGFVDGFNNDDGEYRIFFAPNGL